MESAPVSVVLEAEFPGVPFRFGKRWYIVPSLSLGQVEIMSETLDKIATGSAIIKPEMLGKFTDMLMYAMNRNYPEATREEVMAGVDMKNFRKILAIMIGTHEGPWTRGIDEQGKSQPEMEEAA